MVNVLSGAPYGYRYVRKSESSSAYYYEVIEAEAQVVRMVFEATDSRRMKRMAFCQSRIVDREILIGSGLPCD
jgi:site-specific DNA recombinase